MRRGKVFSESHADNHDATNDSYNHVILSARAESNRNRTQCDNGSVVLFGRRQGMKGD